MFRHRERAKFHTLLNYIGGQIVSIAKERYDYISEGAWIV